MDRSQKIEALAALREISLSEETVSEAINKNPWFTKADIQRSWEAICSQFLDPIKLEAWLKAYPESKSSRTVGLVMAGNIPMVGFHDLLCLLFSPHKAQVKLSGSDSQLIPYFTGELSQIAPELGKQIEYVETLKDFEAVIATGSNNSARYFDHYFGKYPHIIRKNRCGLAVLDGNESASELKALGEDIFNYFGLGCRNVSKLYVPKNYDFDVLLNGLDPDSDPMDHNKYKNNYDYNRTLLMMNNTPHFNNDFIMISENIEMVSPVSSLYFEYYDDLEKLSATLFENKDVIQCVVAAIKTDISAVPMGQSQTPALQDYADGIDTMEFLSKV